jgi:hypothetical protein
MSDVDLNELIIQNLPLPEDTFLKFLKPPLVNLGFKVDIFRDVFGLTAQQLFVHYRAVNESGSVALLYVSEEITQQVPQCLYALGWVASRFEGVVNGIFFFTEAKALPLRFDILANGWVKDQSSIKGAKVCNYGVVEYVASLNGSGLEDVKTLLLLNQIFPPASPQSTSLISQADFNLLVDILMNKADEVDPRDSSTYYWILINKAVLSDEFRRKAKNFKGDSEADAQMLLRMALAQNRNPADTDYTTLGSLLKPLLGKDGANYEHQREVADIIYRNNLYFNQSELDKLAQDFNVPVNRMNATSISKVRLEL